MPALRKDNLNQLADLVNALSYAEMTAFAEYLNSGIDRLGGMEKALLYAAAKVRENSSR